ncbi:MAG: hypothetical protein QGH20_04360 [Candidatus Latescibacteria bacterium]|nr:hypothetical protein [Candidatus Latescibacterota bacterium]
MAKRESKSLKAGVVVVGAALVGFFCGDVQCVPGAIDVSEGMVVLVEDGCLRG